MALGQKVCPLSSKRGLLQYNRHENQGKKKNMTEPVKLIALLKAKPGMSRSEFENAGWKNMPPSR